jgi:hypothetical protein
MPLIRTPRGQVYMPVEKAGTSVDDVGNPQLSLFHINNLGSVKPICWAGTAGGHLNSIAPILIHDINVLSIRRDLRVVKNFPPIGGPHTAVGVRYHHLRSLSIKGNYPHVGKKIGDVYPLDGLTVEFVNHHFIAARRPVYPRRIGVASLESQLDFQLNTEVLCP